MQLHCELCAHSPHVGHPGGFDSYFGPVWRCSKVRRLEGSTVRVAWIRISVVGISYCGTPSLCSSSYFVARVIFCNWSYPLGGVGWGVLIILGYVLAYQQPFLLIVVICLLVLPTRDFA